jgi:hypothetical protein
MDRNMHCRPFLVSYPADYHEFASLTTVPQDGADLYVTSLQHGLNRQESMGTHETHDRVPQLPSTNPDAQGNNNLFIAARQQQPP